MNKDDFGRFRAKDCIDAEMLRSAGVKSRYEKLFGTPERTARMLSEHDTSCRDCLLGAYCGEECLTEEEPKLLEWLRGPV